VLFLVCKLYHEVFGLRQWNPICVSSMLFLFKTLDNSILEHVRIAIQIMMQWCKVEHELECPSDLYYHAVQGVTVSTFTLWLESPVVLCLVWVANWLIMSISNIEFAMFPRVAHKEVGTQFVLFLNSKCKMVWFYSFPVKAVIWCICEHRNKE
jgi:hypothetical protein